MKTFAFTLVTALAIAAGPVSADDAAMLREMQDRAAIEALMWRYVRALDTLDADAYAAVFTEDGSFGSGSQARKGRADLRKMVLDLKKGRADREAAGQPASPPMYHVITNDNLEFVNANEARYHSYWMTVFGAAGQDTPPRVAAAGRGIDELVRVNGQWLIKNRNVAPQ
jgi:3-phenylpropionate/cinnamic acid dioxygenase small subunit